MQPAHKRRMQPHRGPESSSRSGSSARCAELARAPADTRRPVPTCAARGLAAPGHPGTSQRTQTPTHSKRGRVSTEDGFRVQTWESQSASLAHSSAGVRQATSFAP